MLSEKAKQTMEELKATKKELDEFKKAQMGSEMGDMVSSAEEINGVKLILKKFEEADINELRTLSDSIKKEHKGIAMVFASTSEAKVTFLVSLTDDLVGNGLHAGNMIKEIAKACGGGGGGKADMAQAGGKDPSKVDDAFNVARELLK